MLLLVSCYHFISSKFAHASVASQSLNGQWQFKIPEKQIDETIKVPSNWASSGLDYAGSVQYRTRFNNHLLKENNLLSDRYWLNFEAVDYYASVFLNGSLLGKHTGYFAPFRFDVSGIVKEENNDLQLDVDSPDEESSVDWSLHKTLIKGVLNHHDTRPGGAWSDRGQEFNSGGIWGDVTLSKTGPVAIDKVKITSNVSDISLQKTEATVNITLNSNITGNVDVVFTLTRLNVKGEAIGFAESYHTEFMVERVNSQVVNWVLPNQVRELWWPWDWGPPNLYELTTQVYIAGQLSDSNTQQVGFRKFEFDEAAGIFSVNDKPYFIRGTNYIASQWLASMSADDYEQDIMRMREANINSIRVHAHVAGKAFYQRADKLGMIVWQDFPLQWGYSDSLAFQNEAVKQAKSMTDLLFNHASIAFWCGQNEPPWDASWMQYKYATYNPDQNKRLSQAVYQQLLRAEDKRIVRKASYTAEHPWLGWYSATYRDYNKKPKTAIISEFGAQALPNLSMVTGLLNNDTNWPFSSEMLKLLEYHNYQPRETLQIAKIRQGESLSQFVINSQEYQRLVIKYAIEQLRLNKFDGLTAIYQFMFVDSWPAITWSVMDVNRNEKLGYRALKQSYQALLPIIVKKNNQFSVHIVNDSLQHYHNMQLVMTAKNDQTWIMKGLKVQANSKKTVLLNQNIEQFSELVKVSLLDNESNVLSVNDYVLNDM